MVNDDTTCDYLLRLKEFIDTLCVGDSHSMDVSTDNDNSPANTVDWISRKMLMELCSVEAFLSPLSSSLILDTSRDSNVSPYGPANVLLDGSRYVCVVQTRSDALRYLFYALAPIAMDIGVRIASVIQDCGTNGHIPCEISSKAFILFSLWLPHAPQLSPLVSEIFGDDRYGSPFEYVFNSSTEQQQPSKVCPSETTDMDIDETESTHHKAWIIIGEAAHSICKFYYDRGDCDKMKLWWDWSFLFRFLPVCTTTPSTEASTQIEQLIAEINNESSTATWDHDTAARWHAARALAYVFNLRSSARLAFLRHLDVDEEKVPWTPHPWVIIDEETRVQEERIRGFTSILKDNVIHLFPSPSLEHIRNVVPLHRNLVHIGHGLLMYREGKECNSVIGTNATDDVSRNALSRLIMTPTTARNLAMLGTALCTDPYPTPILVCGPRGAGKSSIIRELACCRSKSSSATDLLELHVDEEIDSKTLLGLFTVSDIPGEFTWRPGPLTIAARTGKWVLIEDVDLCPIEIQAALVSVLEHRILPLGVGRNEKCHANFRIFGTCTTRSSTSNSDPFYRGRNVLHSDLWTQVQVVPLPYNELGDIGRELFPTVPFVIIDTVMNIFRMIDLGGRDDGVNITSQSDNRPNFHVSSNRGLTSVRDLIKLLRRISTNIQLEPGTTFITESQRIICLIETYDVLVAANDDINGRLNFLTNIAAPVWGVSVEVAHKHVVSRSPALRATFNYLEVGRCTLPCKIKDQSVNVRDALSFGSSFSTTSNALRLMETIGVGLQQNEPILLVGETGCGKTSVVQTLSKLAGIDLIVQNLSLQTDTADLLGGYRPVEIQFAAREVYLKFVELFACTFSRAQNSEFLMFVSSAYEQKKWKVLSQCFRKASKMGLNKLEELTVHSGSKSGFSVDAWADFSLMAERFERQRTLSDSGMAFSFIEGALVEAIKNGKWVLLDEINLASSETLQRLCSLLDDESGSLTLTERGDSDPIKRHPDFRLIAAMNPATDNGKKDIPSSIRSRFTEIYVNELVDRIELSSVAGGYLKGVIHVSDIEQSETIMSSVDIYLRCRKLSAEALVDSVGQRPRYSMRTFCRALLATHKLTVHQHLPLNRAMLEGFELTFEGSLDAGSRALLKSVLYEGLGKNIDEKVLDIPGRRPGGKNGPDDFILVKPFWLKVGPLKREDWSTEVGSSGKCRFVLTPTTKYNIRRLSRAISAGPWPILLEGPTSTGKTTMVEYVAALSGHRCIRINNHEHTDVQEYTGTYATNPNGQLSFQEGLLVQALRHGYWVILDELNLAPSQVLEALNRLLDDNRELYIPEINEIIRPHENFRLFATQNPSGVYGGRKALSKAFRNRFTELYIDEIPEGELIMILDKRCGCPPSYGKLLVEVMSTLRKKRSKSGVFCGKDGLITARILIRWAERSVSCKTGLATEGYMILAERLRDEDEKKMVQTVIERVFKIALDIEELYWGPLSDARKTLETLYWNNESVYASGLDPLSIAPTKSFLRLITLVDRCVKQKEPVLLVGETGCGKTTVVQLYEMILRRRLQIVNCHANTDTSDLLGGLRPLRGRSSIRLLMIEHALQLEQAATSLGSITDVEIPSFKVVNEDELSSPQDTLVHKIMDYAKLVESLLVSFSDGDKIQVSEETTGKRRKLQDLSDTGNIKDIILSIRQSFKKYFSLFEWVDGPLVSAMKAGNLLLLDEMSLAEDAVLERLNSLLEPSRTIILAEKGTDLANGVDSASLEIKAHDDFRIFATMNPGGDFGKRELSPALRNRFTEIWVPPIVDRCDIDLVLERSLASAFEESRSTYEIRLRACMLDYVEWFNNHLYTAFKSPKCELVLSLRDVLTWATFIVQQKRDVIEVELWMPYLQGAYLMHLDGLGLGTGLSREEANDIKQSATQILEDQLIITGSNMSAIMSPSEPTCFWSRDHGKYGMHPFFISAGPYPVLSPLNFNFNAPTTRANILRVLRAMQLSKPILLEGSPGTGKTSLIAALAYATGHKLVRINLSEQTDWSDLMGSDLPVSDDGERGSGPNFKWCDGILLTAIKNGDWVVLDELNLATQSVLEGLNSCLDHRASVYIPELAMTYSCPKTFRVFAAQNPLIQGGGRKGLPKSFLNRFTKVYVESMTREDYFSIMSTKFPSIPTMVLQQMIEFNSKLENDIVTDKLYGQLGSPWEFNLRDLFRWGDLMENWDGINQPSKYVDTVYIRRLRTERDRETALHTFKSIFDCDKTRNEYPILRVDDERVYCGSAILLRLEQCFIEPEGRRRIRSGAFCHLRSLLLPMEVAANCIRMNWPCLLVGFGGSGKSTIITTLSDLCNSHLEELCLTPSTDVSELIGNFEQTDKEAVAIQFLSDLVDHVISLSLSTAKNVISTQLIVAINKKVLTFVHKYEKLPVESIGRNWLSDSSGRAEVSEILQSLSLLHQMCQHQKLGDMFMILCRKYEDLIQLDLSSVRFRWVDGILVQALEKGYWLHLENVNLCSSSVLDRLNPLLENSGELVLTECSISCEGSNQHRTIKAHPNFRLFLSMDPSRGEISRAMRNRCVEINLSIVAEDNIFGEDPSSDPRSNIETTDALECMWDSGIRSPALARSALAKRQSVATTKAVYKHLSSLRYLERWTQAITAGIFRGIPLWPFSDLSFNVVHSYSGQEQCDSRPLDIEAETTKMYSLVEGYTLRQLEFLRPSKASVWIEARLLKLLSSVPGSLLPLGISCLSITNSGNYRKLYDKYCSTQRSIDRRVKGIVNYLSVAFVMNLIPQNAVFRSRVFDGYKADMSTNIKLLVTRYLQTMGMLLGYSYLPPPNDNLLVLCRLRALTSHRLLRFLEEHQLNEKIRSFPDAWSDTRASVLEISMSIVFDRLDRANILCPLTPLIFPLIHALDEFFDASSILAFKNANLHHQLFVFIDAAYSQGYRFWGCLRNLQYSNELELVGFDHSTFCIQYRWLKKKLIALSSAITETIAVDPNMDISGVDNAYCRLDALIKIFDKVLHINDAEILLRSDIFWKRMGHPQVPATADDHENVIEIIRAAASWFLWNTPNHDILNRDVPIISIEKLLERQHPILYIDVDQKVDALNTLCMAIWATTDETSSSSRATPMYYDTKKATKALKDKIIFKCREFQLKLQQAVTDIAIDTFDNQFNVEELKQLNERHAESNSNSNVTIHENLLRRYASVQISPIAELRCIQEEHSLVQYLLQVASSVNDDDVIEAFRAPFIRRIEAFIQRAVTYTSWSSTDLRPYQTIAWACTVKQLPATEIRNVLRSCSSLLLISFYQHCWFNGYNTTVIDRNLILPDSLLRPTERKVDHPSNDIDVFIGPPRFRQNPISDVFFNILNLEDILIKSKPWVSLENFEARVSQYKNLMSILSSSCETPDDWNLSHCLFSNFLQALSSLCCDTATGQVLASSILTKNEPFPYRYVIEEIVRNCRNQTIIKMLDSVVRPLILILNREVSSLSREDAALSLLYVGLLRFHILLPTSNTDPGRKPALKAIQLDEYISMLSEQLDARRMVSGLDCGDFSPNDDISLQLLSSAEKAIMKRDKQFKKRIERPKLSPCFSALYREIDIFAGNVASVNGVLTLIGMIQNIETMVETIDLVRQTERNWQQSVHSFFYRMRSHYCYYDDVTVPFLSALQTVQYGVRELIALKLKISNPSNLRVLETQDLLLSYPIKDIRPFPAATLLKNLDAIKLSSTGTLSETQVLKASWAYICSVISRLSLYTSQRERPINFEQISLITVLFDRLLELGSFPYDASTDPLSSKTGESSEELNEKEFRDLFPDHEADFSSSEVRHINEASEYTDDKTSMYSMTFSENKVTFLCGLYLRLFQPLMEKVDDNVRIQDFMLAYTAAGLLQKLTSSLDRKAPEGNRLGAHMHAFMLNLSPQIDSLSILSDRSSMATASKFDFHHDPCPWETIRAKQPLESIKNRLLQLLSAFPSNSILVVIYDVVKKLQQYDLKRTSLGKMLTGLEVVLRRAQDWEQHASIHVSIGQPLIAISGIVSKWRKLELQSWPQLLDSLEKRHLRQAQKLWYKLYHLTITNVEGERINVTGTHHNRKLRAIPEWVKDEHSPEFEFSNPHLIDLIKAADTFILTSTVGQYVERLRIIEALARHQMVDYRSNPLPFASAKSIGLTLEGLFNYYGQFLRKVNDVKVRLRVPIEKKLADEVKLAKWDEQSYYSLADSSDKNHRKLIKHLKEYDDVLETPVWDFIEEDMIDGIRSKCVENSGTSMLSDDVMFPYAYKDVTENNEWACGVVIPNGLADIFLESEIASNLIKDKWILNMNKYYRKLQKLIKLKTPSPSENGASTFTVMTTSIFDRMKTLRLHGSKNLKQRALLDLFKTLKDQGFAAGIMPSRSNIRDMSSLLQIPAVVAQGSGSILHFERYWQRCLSETARLRDEVKNYGSQFMNQQEMNLMLGYSEHGLFMLCQQRSVLASAFEDMEAINRYISSYGKLESEIPGHQSLLVEKLVEFDDAYLTAEESFAQLSLILKTAQQTGLKVEEVDDKDLDKISHIISSIEKHVEHLRVLYHPQDRHMIITQTKLDELRSVHEMVLPIIDDMAQYIREPLIERLVPITIFSSCLESVKAIPLLVDDCISAGCAYSMHLKRDASADVSRIEGIISSLIQQSLLVAQMLNNGDALHKENSGNKSEISFDRVWENHQKAIYVLSRCDISRMNFLFSDLTTILMNIEFDSAHERVFYTKLLRDTTVLVHTAVALVHRELINLSAFHRNASKFLYIIIRVFRTLIAQGYCAEDADDSEQAEGGDIKNTKFDDDVAGTGMGEGEGKADVSDQIENEEQLLGLKGDDKKDNGDSKQTNKELNEDEAEKGMEMEADFEGELFEAPKELDEKAGEPEENLEEIDRELGDSSDPNEEVIDEKLWDEDDDGNGNSELDEKFEKNSKVNSANNSDELRTKDDDDEVMDNAPAQSQKSDENNVEQSKGKENELDAPVNEDLEENYEDRQEGVPVRGKDDTDSLNEEDDLKLDQDMNLDSEETADQNSLDDKDGDLPDSSDSPLNETDEDASPENDEPNNTESGEIQPLDEHDDSNPQGDNDLTKHSNDMMDHDQTQNQDALGVPAENGTDEIEEPGEQGDHNNNSDMIKKNKEKNMPDVNGKEDGLNADDRQLGTEGEGIQSGNGDCAESSAPVPNPFRDPGNAEKYWHRRLNLVKDSNNDSNNGSEERLNDDEMSQDPNGTFEFTQYNESSSTQVLASADETSDKNVIPEDRSNEIESYPQKNDPVLESMESQDMGTANARKEKNKIVEDGQSNKDFKEAHSKEDESSKTLEKEMGGEGDMTSVDRVMSRENRVVTDTAFLQDDEYIAPTTGFEQKSFQISSAQSDAVTLWGQLQSETNHLSRRLCEKLRLVMEPLVASKLQGDYRSGKRLNMKRIISYIASGYRKDKIWLRRTKPAKRDYRVLLAVDDSESMKRSGAGLMALRAMAMLINGMTQLEIGQLGIASFGEEMKILHPFQSPFTSDSGVSIVGNFKFEDKRTRTALCVESAMDSMSQDSSSSSPQLLILISDGRIERDSRSKLRSILREMSEQNILVVMLIVEGCDDKSKRDSITDMKEVSFEGGKPKVNFFMDNYPFPYYIIVEEMSHLPDVLGDALRQWFEILAQTQK